MLDFLPEHWPMADIFPGWTEMAAWGFAHQDSLIELAGGTLKKNFRGKQVLRGNKECPPDSGGLDPR